MNFEQKDMTVNLLKQILEDNLNNRITIALANGILHQLDSASTNAIAVENAKANGMFMDMPDATIVKGEQVAE